MELTNPNNEIKRTPLEICAFTIAAIALIVIFLSFSHVIGVGILSRIFSSVPEPQPVLLYPPFLLLIDVVIPIVVFLCALYLILRFLKYAIVREPPQGYRPELTLITFSLMVAALILQYLEIHIQPAGSVNEFLMSASFILLLLTIGVFAIAVYYKFGKKKTLSKCPKGSEEDA